MYKKILSVLIVFSAYSYGMEKEKFTEKEYKLFKQALRVQAIWKEEILKHSKDKHSCYWEKSGCPTSKFIKQISPFLEYSNCTNEGLGMGSENETALYLMTPWGTFDLFGGTDNLCANAYSAALYTFQLPGKVELQPYSKKGQMEFYRVTSIENEPIAQITPRPDKTDMGANRAIWSAMQKRLNQEKKKLSKL